MSKPTVTIEEYQPGIFKLTWQAYVEIEDVNYVFNEILDYLDQPRNRSCSIIMDLLANPQLPMHITGIKAIAIQRNPKMNKWLVLGRSKSAEMIGNILLGLTRKHNVEWFNTSDELENYLHKLTI